MPKTPHLSKFTSYAGSLLPHELDYLDSINNFIDPDNIKVLEQVRRFVTEGSSWQEWDKSINKRKYSRVMHWMDGQLNKIDVDLDYEQLLFLEQEVMADRILPKDERVILKRLQNYDEPCYNFMKVYQLAQHLSSFFLIRMRDKAQAVVQTFLEKYKLLYLKSQDTYQQLNEATNVIVTQYRGEAMDTKHWESWLTSVFQNRHLDGLNRYSAIVRLTFLYYNYKDYSKLKSLYEELDLCFSQGLFYSKRILVNYYSNRVLMHAQTNEWNEAEQYALMSVKFKSADYIHYINNLAAILLRSGKAKAAYKYLQASFPDLKNTTSAHNKVGFVAFYTKALNQIGNADEGLRYSSHFLEANKEAVLKNRWHLYFAALMQSMIFTGAFRQLLQLIDKYKLDEKDAKYQSRPNYLPTFMWYQKLAEYKLKHISKKTLIESISDHLDTYTNDPHHFILIRQLYIDLRKAAPELPISLSALRLLSQS